MRQLLTIAPPCRPDNTQVFRRRIDPRGWPIRTCRPCCEQPSCRGRRSIPGDGKSFRCRSESACPGCDLRDSARSPAHHIDPPGTRYRSKLNNDRAEARVHSKIPLTLLTSADSKKELNVRSYRLWPIGILALLPLAPSACAGKPANSTPKLRSANMRAQVFSSRSPRIWFE